MCKNIRSVLACLLKVERRTEERKGKIEERGSKRGGREGVKGGGEPKGPARGGLYNRD